MAIDAMTLTPTTPPPTGSARWCPQCGVWKLCAELRGRRRCGCGAAVVRQTRHERSLPGELRPGVAAEFDDPRDRYDPSRELKELRARLLTTARASLQS